MDIVDQGVLTGVLEKAQVVESVYLEPIEGLEIVSERCEVAVGK
jgi:hypothetical protein